MSWNIGLATVLSVALGGWMVYDGVRAMYVGDYFTPSSGRYAGQLGPWAGLVQRIGLEPRSTAMKILFILFGIAWLAVAAGLVFATAGVPQIALVLAFATLWYVPIGSAVALAVLALAGAALLG
jgi:hypothetical protein